MSTIQTLLLFVSTGAGSDDVSSVPSARVIPIVDAARLTERDLSTLDGTRVVMRFRKEGEYAVGEFGRRVCFSRSSDGLVCYVLLPRGFAAVEATNFLVEGQFRILRDPGCSPPSQSKYWGFYVKAEVVETRCQRERAPTPRPALAKP